MRVRFLPVVQPRECGECSLCCKLLGVQPLNKPQGQWCTHAKKGVGCAIYETRPEPCRDFQCLWLAAGGSVPANLRPDKVHGLLVTASKGKGLVVHEDAGYPEHARRAMWPALEAWLQDPTQYVVVVCGPRRTFFGKPELLPGVSEIMNQPLPEPVVE